MGDYLGKDTFKLGFGLMRLPKLADGSMDTEQIKEMVDLFIAAGGTYFDTAFVYDGGESEKIAKVAIVDRYPRESFTLCTKMNGHMLNPTEESTKKQFEISLERTGAGYFDYYLLHAVDDRNYQNYDNFKIWDFVREKKEQGLIKHYGFSFHGTPELLDRLLDEHPDVDLVQLQINYADMDNPDVAARRNHEIARAHGKSITIMEPVKGGALANPIDPIKEVFNAAAPGMSPASWAIRYAASLDGIITVLSGMSNVEQMKDNLSYMKDFRPLSDSEQEVIKKAQELLATVETIPCTACHYCTGGCPMSIPIPEIFSVHNRMTMFNDPVGAKRGYGMKTRGKGKASDCIECGQCEGACPQSLPIISLLKECASVFE